MIVQFIILDQHSYYEIEDKITVNLSDLRKEFDRWLSQCKGSHPFKQYHEFVEEDNTVSFAGYVNTYGPEDFIDWLSVNKFNRRIAEEIKHPVDPSDVGMTLYF